VTDIRKRSENSSNQSNKASSFIISQPVTAKKNIRDALQQCLSHCIDVTWVV
jgi:hypothetical protein